MSGSAGEAERADELIAQFIGVTGSEFEDASDYLTAHNWDVQAAAEAYQADQAADEGDEEAGGQTHPSGGRTLGGAGASSSSAPAGKASNAAGKTKQFATLGDLTAAPQPSSSDDEDEQQDLFAGGEKSGLAVQNPDDLKKRIIEKAKKGASRPGGDDVRAQPSNFRGPAQTLGGDDAPSQRIDNEEAAAQGPPERVERRLHFWSNGFSVDDGELYDTADPRNAEILNTIRSGRAPLHIMNVRQDQEVDVKVEPHDGPYVAPKKKYKPFSGSGQRLGSPVPGVSSSSAPAPAPAAASRSTGASSSSGPSQPTVDVDSSQPTVSLQIRLGDGSRLGSRFNTTHTIGDVYGFVSSASPQSQGRSWVLMTTFPNKDQTDKTATLADTPELKKGGVLVQKWT